MTDPASTALAAPRLRPRRRHRRLRGGRRARPGRGLGRRACSPATSTLWSDDPRRRSEAIAERLGWLDAPAHFADQIAGARGRSATASVEAASRPRSSPAWAAAASPRTSSTGRSASTEGYLDLRILDSTDPAAVAGDRRRPRPARRRSGHRRQQVRHDDRAARVPGRRLGPRRGRPSRRSAHHATSSPGELLRGHHRPGQERRGDPPPRRAPRGLPQPARHRRPVHGADLRRARAGVAHRPRPRRAARLRGGDARRLPRAGSGGQPGRLARPRDRDAGQGRPRQADLPRRRRDRAASGRGPSSSSPRAPASTASGSCRSTASRSAPSSAYGPDRVFVRLSLAGVGRRRHATRWPTRSRRPAIRSSGSSSPTRSTSAPSSSAGRSRRRSPAPSSASTRSTSRTSRRPRS